MEVTAVIPFYGQVEHLERAVDSILAQKGCNPQVLIIDDRSPESAPQFGSPQVRTLRTLRNRGGYFARAVGLELTRTEYTLVIDHDDWVDPDWVASLADLDKPVAQMGALVQESLDGTSDLKIYPNAEEPVGRKLSHRTSHVGLYRTECLRQIGGYTPGWRMGWDTLMVAAVREHFEVGVCYEMNYHRLLRPDSVSNSESTGLGSYSRDRARRVFDGLWWQIKGKNLARCRSVFRKSATSELWRAVKEEASRLEEV